jgi:hypothetical protein
MLNIWERQEGTKIIKTTLLCGVQMIEKYYKSDHAN